MVLSVLLSACTSTEEGTASPTPSPQAVVTEPVSIDEDDATSSDEASIDQCIVCHSDKQALIDTAMPEQDLISENEGEG